MLNYYLLTVPTHFFDFLVLLEDLEADLLTDFTLVAVAAMALFEIDAAFFEATSAFLANVAASLAADTAFAFAVFNEDVDFD